MDGSEDAARDRRTSRPPVLRRRAGTQPADPSIRRCFRDSVAAGFDIEFARIETTTEGDPIATIYGFEPPDAFVMLVDSTQDAFGAGAWTVVTCQGLVDDPTTVFSFDGCTEGRTFR